MAVTWLNVPEYGTTTSNSFQVELFSNGVLRLTWLNIAAADGLAGLSQGLDTPVDFTASDLTAYPECISTAPATVEVAPQPLTDCTPLSVLYRATGRPLEGISPLYASFSFDGGPLQHVPMSGGAGGVWHATSAIPLMVQNVALNFRSVSNVTEGVVDDNGSTNWPFAVQACAGFFVTNPVAPLLVPVTQSAYRVEGYASTNILAGQIVWSNLLSGAVGTTAVARSWAADGVSLAAGTNLIRFTATNNPQTSLLTADHGTEHRLQRRLAGRRRGRRRLGGWRVGSAGVERHRGAPDHQQRSGEYERGPARLDAGRQQRRHRGGAARFHVPPSRPGRRSRSGSTTTGVENTFSVGFGPAERGGAETCSSSCSSAAPAPT